MSRNSAFFSLHAVKKQNPQKCPQTAFCRLVLGSKKKSKPNEVYEWYSPKKKVVKKALDPSFGLFQVWKRDNLIILYFIKTTHICTYINKECHYLSSMLKLLDPLPQKLGVGLIQTNRSPFTKRNRVWIVSLYLYLTVLHVQTLKNGYGTPGECQKEELYCHWSSRKRVPWWRYQKKDPSVPTVKENQKITGSQCGNLAIFLPL